MKLKLQKTIYMLSRYFLYGFVVQLLIFNFVLAVNVNGQYKSISDVHVKIDRETLTLNQFFGMIQKQTPFQFSFDQKDIDKRSLIFLEKKDGTVEEFLSDVSKQTSLRFRQLNNSIDAIKLSENIEDLPAIVDINIRGTVKDENGDPLPGATVTIDGTSRGTVTDIDGNYTLEVPDDAVLVISFIGYKALKVPVGNRTVIETTMELDESSLQEVVVVGYGMQKRSDLTGSIGSLKEEAFNKGVIVSPEQLLQGKIAGVNVTATSGEPGAASRMTIRGPGSVRSGSGPLFVVDGVALDNASSTTGGADLGVSGSAPANPLNFLNPADIESIDVLKDASATAIYGSRGANGVVLITTKKGDAAEPKLNYSSSFAFSQVTKTIDVLNAQQFRDFTNQYGDPDNIGPANTFWQDEIFRSAFTHDHNISYGGGTKNGNFYASISALDQEGVVMQSSMKRYTARMNMSQRFINDRLKFGINLTTSNTRNDSPPIGDNAGVGGDALSNALTANPTYPTRNADGSAYLFPEGINPLMMMDMYTEFSKVNRVLGNIDVGFEIFKGLEYKLNVAVDNSQGSRISQISRHTVQRLPHPGGRLQDATTENGNFLTESFLNYRFSLGDGKHDFSVLAGYSYQKFNNSFRFWSINNFATTEIEAYRNPGIGSDLSIGINRPGGGASENELQSYFSRINYNYDEKYYLTATMRADGSSRFGADNRYGYFPSFSAAWQISNESFLSSAVSLSNLRLRAGWGRTGNQDIPSYITQQLLTVNTGPGSGYALTPGANSAVSPGINFVRLQNPGIKWEVSSQTNIGFDFGFFGEELYGTVDVFRKVSSDILWETLTGVDPIVATSSFWSNYPMEIENTGLEIALGYRKNIGTDFRLDIGGNISFLRNNVSNLPVSILRTGGIGGPGLSGVQVNGFLNDFPVGTFWIHEWIGLDEAGNNQFRDVDGDGLITDADFVNGGSGLPRTIFGFYTNASYKRFDLTVNFNGVSGNQIYWNDENAYFNLPRLVAGNNVSTNVLDFPEESRNNSASPSTRFIHDGDFIRLNNASLGYNFNTSSISWLQNMRFSVTGQNLLTITNYPGFDPEVDTPRSQGGFVSTGIDGTRYPTARALVLGLNITF
ncbi:SusC/RagA family TonB-linked outer membrane protein [Lunatibacter salilacus]|uniref:SusC/RagA family TonB-linked outer membrane protein n=1 Tax=Lunatibacter salilacus TaxID=2483804 RepID=UPI001F1F3D9E|nr:TonB-dependent receptor [Lunatibacter salilacus]